jgi:hypothetical protein
VVVLATLKPISMFGDLWKVSNHYAFFVSARDSNEKCTCNIEKRIEREISPTIQKSQHTICFDVSGGSSPFALI